RKKSRRTTSLRPRSTGWSGPARTPSICSRTWGRTSPRSRSGSWRPALEKPQTGLARLAGDGVDDPRSSSQAASGDPYHLLAQIDPAVGAADRRVDSIAGLKVLRPAALRLQEQLPELPLGQKLHDPPNRRRRNAQRAAGGGSRQQHVSGGDVGEGRQFGDRLGRLEHEIGRAVALARDAVDRQPQIQPVEFAELVRLEDGQPRADRTEAAIALALEELRLRQLHVARAEVIGDRHAEDIVLERRSRNR